MTIQHQIVSIEEQSPAPPRDEVVPEVELAMPDAGSVAPDPITERWQHIQAGFVDDPRRSLADAHRLVSELMQLVVDSFGRERAELERQWSQGGDVSTEELRLCLQRYRAFFGRLLPAIHGLEPH